ncbi:hypothetical protein GCM10010912_61800 [Paenibacillus albidus]|uniref:Uncharacterized protein n=1 Tax=Paenibacillus albidus TaxID=2041023 RepID=A0A917D1R8_9BACL|nr:hypothetical protein GCM10010912_61800 [Paenibacillus albidus]
MLLKAQKTLLEVEVRKFSGFFCEPSVIYVLGKIRCKKNVPLQFADFDFGNRPGLGQELQPGNI